jgi:hypothetical protein
MDDAFHSGQVFWQGPAHGLFAGGFVERCAWGKLFIRRRNCGFGCNLCGTHPGLQFQKGELAVAEALGTGAVFFDPQEPEFFSQKNRVLLEARVAQKCSLQLF